MKLPNVNEDLYNGPVTVEFNRKVSRRYWKMRVTFESTSFDPAPGQFAHLRVADHHEPLLRRPFSFHDVPAERQDGETAVDFLYAVVGKGTRIMANLDSGDELEMLGPLGNRFSVPGTETTPVLLGGGVGIPPVHMFARELSRFWPGSKTIHVLTGARTAADVLCEEDFARHDVEFYISTDDGSRGFSGYVTELFRDLYQSGEVSGDLHLYGCGPPGMLDAIRELALQEELPAEIAIERQMGCALGVCRACVVKVRDPEHNGDRVATVCREGPVFEVRRLREDWNSA